MNIWVNVLKLDSVFHLVLLKCHGLEKLRFCFSAVLCTYVKEGRVLFNDALNIFYLQLYGVGHMVKDHSDSERGNLLLPHRLLFPNSTKGSFI